MDYAKRTEQVLKNFGLSDNETTVYQSALILGKTSPFGIAKATGIPRTTVYAVLTDLALKGLVELEGSTGLMKQQTKVTAKNPSVLRSIIHDKRDTLIRQEVDIVEILPFLKKEYLKDATNADFQFFPGMGGANHVMFDYGSPDEDTYIFDYLVPMDATGSHEMNQNIDRNLSRWEKGVGNEYNLVPINAWSKHALSYQVERTPLYLSRVFHRTLPFELTHLNIMVRLQGERTWIVSVEGDEVWGLKVRSHNLTHSLIDIHQALWKLATPITKDTVAAWGPNPYLRAENS